MTKLLEATREELVAQLPSYFNAWDLYAADKDYAAKPALHIHDLQHYIRRHDRADPCAEHRNRNFPCGCAASRRDCRDRLSLRDVECNRLLDLRAMDRLVASYNFHRASNDHQKPAIDALLRMPALGRLSVIADWAELSVIADWAELMTLPLLPKATDTSFYGTARKELAVFGCCLVEHADSSTADRPVLRKGFLLFISDILDHTACRTTSLLAKAVTARLSSRKLEGIDFISDCAGHFRSYETMRFRMFSWFDFVKIPSNFQDSETLELNDPETRRRMDADPMFRVEKTLRDLQKERSEKERLADLQELQADREDAYGWNCAMRKAHRVKRKEEKRIEEEERLKGKPNFAVPLVPQDEDDVEKARQVSFSTDHEKIEVAARRSALKAQPVLSGDKKTAAVAKLVAKRKRLQQHSRMVTMKPPAWRRSSSCSWMTGTPAGCAMGHPPFCARRENGSARHRHGCNTYSHPTKEGQRRFVSKISGLLWWLLWSAEAVMAFQQIGEQFCQHYYQTFDSNRCPDVVLVTSVLNACGRAAHVDRAILLFEDMRRWSIDPSPVSYAAVINACAKCGWMAASFVTTATISACGRAGHWQLSLALLEDRLGRRSDEVHNRFSWRWALRLLGELTEEMEADVVCFGAAISACETAAEWQHALNLLQQLLQAELLPNTVIFNALASFIEAIRLPQGCFPLLHPFEEKAGRWPLALQLLTEAQALQLADLVTFNAVISACEKGQQWRKALELLALAKGLVKIDVISCNAAQSACGAASRWQLLAAAGLGALVGFCLARAVPRWIEKMQSFPVKTMVFTSLPDMSEVVEFLGPRFEDWEQQRGANWGNHGWMAQAVRQILGALPLNGVAVFYQTDVRLAEKGQVSKAFLVLKAAQEVPQAGPVRLKWHKIVHFGTIDQPTWNAVQFTHLLCFAKGPPEVARVGCQGLDDEVVDLGSTIPDVLERGPKPSLRKGA
eukprot:s722_g11.t1